jgi:hypothetical protein
MGKLTRFIMRLCMGDDHHEDEEIVSNRTWSRYTDQEEPSTDRVLSLPASPSVSRKVTFGGSDGGSGILDLQMPRNLAEAVEDLDNDCDEILDRATKNAERLAEVLDTLILNQTRESHSTLNKPRLETSMRDTKYHELE